MLTGCAATVSTGYVGETYPYDPYAYGYAPYDYGSYYVPAPDIYVFGRDHGHRHYEHEFSHRGLESRRAMGPHSAPNAGGFRGTARGTGHGSSSRHR